MSNEQVRASNPTENRNTHIVGTSSAGVRFTNLDDALLHAEALERLESSEEFLRDRLRRLIQFVLTGASLGWIYGRKTSDGRESAK